MENKGHTPLPWQAQEPDEADFFVPIIGVLLGDDGKPLETPTNGLVGGAMLFPTEIDDGDYERARTNAAFIVRAVNSHYELLEALREIADDPYPYGQRVQKMKGIARAALSRATEGGA